MSLEKKLKQDVKTFDELVGLIEDIDEKYIGVGDDDKLVPRMKIDAYVKESSEFGNVEWVKLQSVLEEIGKVAQKINKTIEDTKVDMLGMFCYQGPPTKHWIETKGQFWMGWNEACNKILEKLAGLLVENSKEKGEK